MRNFNNCLKKQLEAWRQRATPTQIEVIDVYKQFEGKNLMSRDGIHPNKKGLTTLTELYRRACEPGHMTVAMESDSEDEEQQFWLPKTATTATRLPTSDTQGTPVVADETLTPGPLLSGASHDGTVLETLQLGPSADTTGTPVKAKTPRAREKRSQIPQRFHPVPNNAANGTLKRIYGAVAATTQQKGPRPLWTTYTLYIRQFTVNKKS